MKQVVLAALIFVAASRFAPWTTSLELSLAFYAAFLALRLYQFSRNVRISSHIPGNRFLLTPWSSLLTLFLPPIPYINAPLNHKYNDALAHRAAYDRWNSTIWSVVSALAPRISLFVADATTIKHIVADRHTFPKPLDFYRILSVYGENVLITEGNEWRKHRKIVGSAFTDSTNELDWRMSTKVTRDWMKDLERRADPATHTTQVDDVSKLCLHLALSVICSTAFGVTIASPGAPPDPLPERHLYNFKDTLEGALETLFVTVATPKAIAWLPLQKLKQAKRYKAELDRYMTEIVDERRKALAQGQDEERRDLLSALVKANDALLLEEEKERGAAGSSSEKTGSDTDDMMARKSEVMDQDELGGNLFIFLVAGHETSAHTLAFALGLLALHPEEQERLHASIVEHHPYRDSDIPYADYPLFTRALAVFYETLRMYPSVIGIPKRLTAEHDAVLPCSERGPGGATNVFVPKGTYISLDVQSLHHDRGSRVSCLLGVRTAKADAAPMIPDSPLLARARSLQAGSLHAGERLQPGRVHPLLDGRALMSWFEIRDRRDCLCVLSGCRPASAVQCSAVQMALRLTFPSFAGILVNLCRNYTVKLHPDDRIPGESLDNARKRLLLNTSKLTLSPLNLRLDFESRT